MRRLDEAFPRWLFFLDKRSTSLRAVTLCMLPPFLTPEGKARVFPNALSDLLQRRWFPAMKDVTLFAGLTEAEIAEFAHRCCQCMQGGPLTAG